MITIEIYWDDLTKEKQEEIRQDLHLDPDDDNNWSFFPIATLDIEEDE